VTIFFLVVRRVPPRPSPVLLEVYEILRSRGHDVGEMIAEETVARSDLVIPRHDLYVLKSHTQLSLSLAGILHAQGARLVNPYPACALTQNKIVVSRLLRREGVPCPRSWVTGELLLLRHLVDGAEATPLIVKPYMGHRGAGIHVVRSASELEAIPAAGGPYIVQELIEGNGRDLKLYVVGKEVFAVEKPFSETSFSVPGRPVPVRDEIRKIALACGRACGIGLYGVDVIEGPRGPFVVDVNYFPGYKGVPRVALLIADWIDAQARAVSAVSRVAS
jgi:ribosomal protein S6--L-glutamate ligase